MIYAYQCLSPCAATYTLYILFILFNINFFKKSITIKESQFLLTEVNPPIVVTTVIGYTPMV